MKQAARGFAAFLLLATALGAQTIAPECTACARPKPVYKVTKLSLTDVAISCNNGADPTGRKVGNLTIISCGK